MKTIENLSVLNNYEIEIKFTNGETKIFDMKPYFSENNVFSTLKDIHVFKLAKNHSYFIEWPGEIDLSADTLYSEGKTIAPITKV